MQQASQALSKPATSTATASSVAPATSPVITTPNRALNREVFGFVQAGNLASPYVGWQTYNLSLLSTLGYFGLHVCASSSQANCSGQPVGGFANDSGWSQWNSSSLSQMVQAAHAAGVRVVLTVIYQATDSSMCAALSAGATTASLAAAQVRAKGIDGVNIDYEGAGGGCGSNTEAMVTQFVADMRADLPVPYYLTIDTYGASAAFPGRDGFFNVTAMAPYVSAFFVMAYELDDSDWSGPPANCSRYCLSPTSPLSAYKWSDTNIASQYSAAVGPGKTILGLPYYGWAACVTSSGPNAYPSTNPEWLANTQYGLDGINIPWRGDQYDQVDPWASWNASNVPSGLGFKCTGSDYREVYMDSPSSLAAKYQLVLNDGLSGAGIWSLDMGGGMSSLWNALQDKFSNAPRAVSQVNACPGNGFAVVNWTPGGSGAAPITASTVTANPGGSASSVGGLATSAVVANLSDGTPYTVAVQSQNSYGTGPPAYSNPVTPASGAGVWPGQFHSLSPQRLLDTRNGSGIGTIAPGQTQNLAVQGYGGVPAGAGAVVLNLTATDAAQVGYVTSFASGTCRPFTSSVNFGAGQTVANMVTVPIGANGEVSLYNGSQGTIDLVADVFGYYSDSATSSGAAGHLVPSAAPVRLLDTRTTNSPLGPGQARSLPVTQSAGGSLPNGISAVVVNLTAVNPTSTGWLAAYAGGTTWTGTSNVNFTPGQVVPNRAVVAVGSNGDIQILNSGGYTQVVVDLSGYFTGAAQTSTHMFASATPLRMLDTRVGTGGISTPVGPGQSIQLSITGQPGLPATPGSVSAVVLTLTATGASTTTYVTAYPDGASPPLASDLNPEPGASVANEVVVGVGADGKIDLYNSNGSVNLIADLVGWFN